MQDQLMDHFRMLFIDLPIERGSIGCTLICAHSIINTRGACKFLARAIQASLCENSRANSPAAYVSGEYSSARWRRRGDK